MVTELGDEEVFAVADLIRREALLAAIRRNDFGSLDLPVGDVVTLDPSAKVAVGDIVLFRARPHTTSATDALGYVDQHAPPVLGHFVVGGSLRRSGLNVLPGAAAAGSKMRRRRRVMSIYFLPPAGLVFAALASFSSSILGRCGL